MVEADPSRVLRADASWSAMPGVACTIMTADCLPALFCDRSGTRVAAAHAGWRGLAAGVLEATVDSLGVPGDELLVWLGPAIGPRAFEVGGEVRDAFVAAHAEARSAFVPSANPGRFMADMYRLARIRLGAHGVTAVHGGGFCTFSDTARFYSYRRSSRTGRLPAWSGSRTRPAQVIRRQLDRCHGPVAEPRKIAYLLSHLGGLFFIRDTHRSGPLYRRKDDPCE